MRNRERITGVKLIEYAPKLGAVGLRAARSLAKDFLATGSAELVRTRFQALTIRRYPCITVNHGTILYLTFATGKCFSIGLLVLVQYS